MTLKELLETIGIIYSFMNKDNPILNYNIKIDVTIKDFKYQTRQLSKVTIEEETKTITLKGKL